MLLVAPPSLTSQSALARMCPAPWHTGRDMLTLDSSRQVDEIIAEMTALLMM